MANHELDAGRLAQSREFGVPYDRNREGEPLHFYTTPFADRFIFKFVERRAVHRDDGISIASTRLAAHAAMIGTGVLG